MRISPGLLACTLCFVASRQPAAADDSAAGSLATFRFNGLEFGTSWSSVKARFPQYQFNKDQSDNKASLTSYTIVGVSGSDGAILSFHEGKLFRVQVIYNPDRITDKMGGVKSLLSRLTDSFGDADSFERPSFGLRLTWNQSPINRRAELIVSPQVGASLIVADTKVEETINRRKGETADLGF
jgi:hypothetical protein